MWHKRDTMTQAHYVQSGNGHFNAGAQKNLTVLSVRLKLLGQVTGFALTISQSISAPATHFELSNSIAF